MRLKNKEEIEATLLMGNVWDVQDEGRIDQTKRMMVKLLHKKRETTMEKLCSDQKRYVLDVVTNDLGLLIGEMWPFMYSDSKEEGKEPYEDIAEVEEDLEILKGHMESKKKKLVEAVNLGN